MTSSWRCWVCPTAHIIFSHHFAQAILVAFTERPTMPTSTPLFDALGGEKSTQRDKEVVQRNNPYYSDAARASKNGESKKKAGAAPMLLGRRSKVAVPLPAPLGKRAANSAAAGRSPLSPVPPRSRTGNASAAPYVAKPSPSKGKSGCGSLSFKVGLTPHARNDPDPTLPTLLHIRFSSQDAVLLFLPSFPSSPTPPPSPLRTSSTSPSPLGFSPKDLGLR